MEIDRKTFLKEKLNNFILFIENTFGKNNILLREFSSYIDIDKSIEPFLKGILQLCNFLDLPMDNEDKKNKNMLKLNTFLEYKGLSTSEENKFKMLRYFELFFKTF